MTEAIKLLWLVFKGQVSHSQGLCFARMNSPISWDLGGGILNKSVEVYPSLGKERV